MKRYLVFAYYSYYPGGGWNDFKGDFDSIEEAEEFITNKGVEYDFVDIVDSFSKCICKEYTNPYE